MSLSYNYGTLSAALQAWSENTAVDLVSNMPDIIQKGELRLYHALDLDNLDPVVSTPAVSGQTGIVAKPANLIRERTVTAALPNTSLPVVLLMHMDGTAGQTTFLDSAFNANFTNTGNGIVVETTQVKFGTAAMSLPATATSQNIWVTAPVTAGGILDIAFGGDFTIEGWFYLTPGGGVVNMIIVDYGNSGVSTNAGIVIYASATNGLSVSGLGTWAAINQSAAITTGVWHHFAVVRKAAVGTAYVDGVQTATTGNWTQGAYIAPHAVTFGWSPVINGSLQPGFVDEVRVTQTAVYTAGFVPPAAPFANPLNAASGALVILRKCSYEFAVQYLMDNGVNQGLPKYYSELSATQWQLAGLPDQAYILLVRGIFRPTLLGDNPEATNLAGIAASQHTTVSTALTLTTSPFVYANAVPALPSSQVWLFSTGNMATTNFTIVGLDDDGNAQTEIVTGPNGGTTISVGTYSQVTTITPSATDNTNFVTAGWSQDNSTWLSTRFPELLFWYCQQYACQFNKRWTAAKLAEEEIGKLLPFAQMVTRSLKRNDFDDLYSARQNVGSPGAVPLPVPPQTGQAQQGQ